MIESELMLQQYKALGLYLKFALEQVFKKLFGLLVSIYVILNQESELLTSYFQYLAIVGVFNMLIELGYRDLFVAKGFSKSTIFQKNVLIYMSCAFLVCAAALLIAFNILEMDYVTSYLLMLFFHSCLFYLSNVVWVNLRQNDEINELAKTSVLASLVGAFLVLVISNYSGLMALLISTFVNHFFFVVINYKIFKLNNTLCKDQIKPSEMFFFGLSGVFSSLHKLIFVFMLNATFNVNLAAKLLFIDRFAEQFISFFYSTITSVALGQEQLTSQKGRTRFLVISAIIVALPVNILLGVVNPLSELLGLEIFNNFVREFSYIFTFFGLGVGLNVLFKKHCAPFELAKIELVRNTLLSLIVVYLLEMQSKSVFIYLSICIGLVMLSQLGYLLRRKVITTSAFYVTAVFLSVNLSIMGIFSLCVYL